MGDWWVPIASIFVLWWLVLFAMLPWGMRTQDEEENVTLGTTSSAPRRPRLLRVMFFTTLITAVLAGGFYGVTDFYGVSLDDVPHIVPEYRDTGER